MIFEDQDFNVFNDDTLEGRMTLIRTDLDPKFENFATAALPVLNENGQVWYAHVAKHLRRTVYPPENTWVAFAPNKRGYKMMPHFELGFWDDHLYLYLSFLENLKKDTATQATWTEQLQAHQADFEALPSDFVISPNHMEKTVVPLDVSNLNDTISAYGQKKHTEFSVGITIARGDDRFGTDALDALLLDTIRTLLPIYQKFI